jgi:hypothetical protein
MLNPWRWRHYDHSKRRLQFTQRHDVHCKKTRNLKFAVFDTMFVRELYGVVRELCKSCTELYGVVRELYGVVRRLWLRWRDMKMSNWHFNCYIRRSFIISAWSSPYIIIRRRKEGEWDMRYIDNGKASNISEGMCSTKRWLHRSLYGRTNKPQGNRIWRHRVDETHEGRVQWCTVLKTVMNILVQLSSKNFFISEINTVLFGTA